MRNLEREHDDTTDRRYAYDFDYRMHEYMLRSFAPLPAGSALELGCYHGEFTKRLCARFEAVTVCEGAADLIAIARANAPGATFVEARFEEFEPAARFDAVFLIHTLEHLDDPVGVLARIRGWLAPAARLFVAVPNAFAASRQIAVEMGLVASPTAVTEAEFAHGHRRTYDRAALARDVEAAGLRVERGGGIFFKPFANFQFDKLIASGAIDEGYLEGCYRLGDRYPDLCASIYAVARVAEAS